MKSLFSWKALRISILLFSTPILNPDSQPHCANSTICVLQSAAVL
jgi:hypothetical protein